MIGGRVPDGPHPAIRRGRGGAVQARGLDEALGRRPVRLRRGVLRRRARDVRRLRRERERPGHDREGARQRRRRVGGLPRADRVRRGQGGGRDRAGGREEDDRVHGRGGGDGELAAYQVHGIRHQSFCSEVE